MVLVDSKYARIVCADSILHSLHTSDVGQLDMKLSCRPITRQWPVVKIHSSVYRNLNDAFMSADLTQYSISHVNVADNFTSEDTNRKCNVARHRKQCLGLNQ